MNEQEFIQVNTEKLSDIMGVDDTIATAAVTMIDIDIQTNRQCPHCNESYYMENYSISTCMYYPPIYKDGVNINPDRNTTTVCCTCMNCNKDFSYQR